MEQEERHGSCMCFVLPLCIGGVIGASVAMIFAPQFLMARGAVCATADRARRLMHERKSSPKTAKPGKKTAGKPDSEVEDILF